jgi:hypothetical protein
MKMAQVYFLIATAAVSAASVTLAIVVTIALEPIYSAINRLA